jgi:hypothetical protein
MHRTMLTTIGVLALATVAHAGNVRTQADDQYDFSRLKTFSASIGTKWGNEMSEKRVLAEVEKALEAKGWQKVPESEADARVVVHGATENKVRLDTFYDGWGGWGYRGWGGMSSSTTNVSEYRQGTLLVDVFDAGQRQLVFRGTAEDELSDKTEKNVKKIENATKKMFKDFPPTPKIDKQDAAAKSGQ